MSIEINKIPDISDKLDKKNISDKAQLIKGIGASSWFEISLEKAFSQKGLCTQT